MIPYGSRCLRNKYLLLLWTICLEVIIIRLQLNKRSIQSTFWSTWLIDFRYSLYYVVLLSTTCPFHFSWDSFIKSLMDWTPNKYMIFPCDNQNTVANFLSQPRATCLTSVARVFATYAKANLTTIVKSYPSIVQASFYYTAHRRLTSTSSN